MKSKTVRCKECYSMIEYDEIDVLFGPATYHNEQMIYIICPECEEIIPIGMRRI